MKYSIIIQSYLGPYKGAAANREEKIIRAVNSVLKQTFEDYEIIIVADGCQKTFDIICQNYLDHENIECFMIQKQHEWSGHARNFGIEKASGDYILYLDIDDYIGANHLEKINGQLGGYDWVHFNDIVIRKDGLHEERECMIRQKFQNGTSNICHKRSLAVKWNGNGYGLDDYSITQALLRYPKQAKIETPEYYVCHIPGFLDV
ncbi:MAG: glycosyltransferase family A protein [Bacteroidota bacterium]